MLRGDRLAELIRKEGLSNPRLGQIVGLSASMIGKMVRGETHQTAHIYAIATALKTSPDYLMGKTDDPSPIASSLTSVQQAFEQLDVVQVPLLDLKFGMGGGTVLDDYHEPKMLSLSRDWVRIFTNSDPQYLFLASGIGDSMFPTIGDGDLMLCDRSQTNPVMSDQIWALTQYGHGMIKRLRPMENGYKILSDNQNVPPDTAVDGSMSIIGRVVAVMRRT